MNKINLKISVKEPKIFVSIGKVIGVKVEKSKEKTMELFYRILEKIKNNYDLENLKDHPVVRAYRDFYWRIGIDPTKQRPSSEALLRRGLKGNIPIINNVVDAGNITSMETLVPIGLYDLDLIEGELELRLARREETFEPIGGKKEGLKENQIVLADEKKILHVYPHRDSKLTMIRETTKNVLVVACGVSGVEKEIVLEACRKASDYIVKLAGGEGEGCKIVK
jgi:DNA/RNA-binding domain of Phe-tRNA-synthetase-like protein